MNTRLERPVGHLLGAGLHRVRWRGCEGRGWDNLDLLID